MEENLCSNTLHTSKVEEEPTVKARTKGVNVELMKVSNAFSLDFQVR